MSYKKYQNLVFYLLFVLIFTSCDILDSNKKNTRKVNIKVFDHKIMVYSGQGNEVSIISTKDYALKKICMPVPDSVNSYFMMPTSNSNYLICCGGLNKPPYTNYILSYDMIGDSVYSEFYTELEKLSAPSLFPSIQKDSENIFYLYSNRTGMYKIDFVDQNASSIYFDEGFPRNFYTSSDDKVIASTKYFPGYDKDYTELYLFSENSCLNDPYLILNESDKDSINIKRLVFSDDNETIYLSYLLSRRRGVYEVAFFGSYNLNTGELSKNKIPLSWSSNSYSIAHSNTRKECYMIGESNIFYIIDVSTNDYKIIDSIVLSKKSTGPARIVIHPDGDIAFINCYYDDIIFVFDLESKSVINEINMESPALIHLLYRNK